MLVQCVRAALVTIAAGTLLAAAAPANAQPSIVGTWQGYLKSPSGIVVRRVRKVGRDTNGALVATA